ncbi:magnesium and cobalt transport protein CorA [Euzebyella marina]|uniref:Magnesium transport protein CorA n=2 Tax=Euzebyella marina TaxID=1761453 RepID=A0A3G2L700_9FLAO|nr:magnesium and cobalt transport protein CorA [Euzebyella marina]MBG48227.1 magnesium and cobalt transport protein CorA [Pseudozobellia sp.]|tara:strand:+ start:536572 stop:537675 length:1104 start_codon:yes stop_codon:yes gene_type:complete
MAKPKKRKLLSKLRPRKQSKFDKKMGKAPGTITYMGKREGKPSVVNIMEYNNDDLNITSPGDIETIVAHRDPPMTSWIDIIGISDEQFIEQVGKRFGLNSLVMEDTVNPHQRPKIDEYEEYIFGVFKMLYIDDDTNELVYEHVALILLENCVLVFQELEDDVFAGVRSRVRNKSGRIRSRGADYLFFALLDAIVDNYFVILEFLNDKIETLEELVYQNPTQEIAHEIQDLKKQVLKVRRWISPVRELVGRLIDSENPLITKDTKVFLRDVLDHSLEINESLQIYREMSMSLMEMYMSNMSNKMNEVMKVLTIMASIFIPLTFIAGIYGMNFDHMPELHWEHGYPMVWGIMIVLFIGMMIYFKRKNWL